MDITGRLVRLRAFRPDDAPRIVEVLADPRVVEHLDQWSRAPYTEAMAAAWVAGEGVPPGIHWAVECREDGAFIGSTGLEDIDHVNRRCEWGIWTGPPQRWGRGYGTEACMLAVEYAFRHLALEKVVLEVYAGNPRARRAYEKAGFAREGLLRRHHWRDGALIDVEMMAVFRDNPLYGERIALHDEP